MSLRMVLTVREEESLSMTDCFGEDGGEFLGVVCGEPGSDTILRIQRRRRRKGEREILLCYYISTEQYTTCIYNKLNLTNCDIHGKYNNI